MTARLLKSQPLRDAMLAAGFALMPAAAIAAGTPAKSALHTDTTHVSHAPAASAPEPFFHLKYADSLSSVNDRCVVTHNHLNPAIHPLYVNSRPVGFC